MLSLLIFSRVIGVNVWVRACQEHERREEEEERGEGKGRKWERINGKNGREWKREMEDGRKKVGKYERKKIEAVGEERRGSGRG